MKVFLSVLCFMFLISTFAKTFNAVDDTLIQQFLGSPLLILAAMLVMAAVASLYYRIRK